MDPEPASLAELRTLGVFEVLASHAHVAPAQLQSSMRTTELGLSRLEMALALFDIEDRFDVDLAVAPGAADPTVGQLVQQVLSRVDAPGTGVGQAGLHILPGSG